MRMRRRATETSGPTTDPGGRRGRGALTVVLAVVLVLLVAVSAGAAYVRSDPAASPFGSSADSAGSDRERAQAQAVAEQFTLRMDNVDGAKFDDYVAGIDEMLTTKAQAENKETLSALEQSYREAEVKGTGKVLVTGVSSLSDDKASVLVAHDAQVSTTQGDIEHHYRWTIDLVKVDGDWLVDRFTPVA